MNTRSFMTGLCTVLGAAAILSTASSAQSIRNHNSNAPVDFTAGSLELQDRADRVVLAGGVTVTQAGLVLKSSRLTAAYSSNGGGTDVERRARGDQAFGQVKVEVGDTHGGGSATPAASRQARDGQTPVAVARMRRWSKR